MDNIDKYFSADKLGHAYLIYSLEIQPVINIAKIIFKQNGKTDENIDYLIDNNEYVDLKIIKPDGQWIKKEQILELKTEFKHKSVYNNKRIYIIENAEEMNIAAANTLLKFLEEPDENIIALLITKNKNKVLETVVSRCQYISLSKDINSQDDFSEDILEIVEKIELKKQTSEIDLCKLFNKISDRKEIKRILSELLYVYDKILELKINNQNHDKFDKYAKNNTIESIIKKLNALIFCIDAMDYNINIKLLVDKLMVLMFGVD